jgi:glycosyltransferase involved in cell wall biosynthesis
VAFVDMRVLFLAPHSYYIDRGSPIDSDILLKALSNRGVTVDAVVYHEGEHRDYPNLTIHRIRAPSWLRNIGPGFSIKKLLCDLLLWSRARSLVNQGHYDLVHAVEESAFIAAWFKYRHGIPYIYDMDSSLAQQTVEQMPALRPLQRIFIWSERKLLRGSVAVAPVCNALADIAMSAGARHVVTLHDISQLDSESTRASGELRTELGIAGTMALYVGNLEPYQGIDLLLESFQVATKEDTDLTLVIAGGTLRHIKKYHKKAERLGIAPRTHFIGPWPASRLSELLLQSDILVVPRIRGVNTPMKIFPFMHSGRAVLATRLPTHTQLVDDTLVYLAPANPEEFGRSLVTLASDGDLRERLGEAACRFVQENHVFSAHQERVDRLYDWVEAAGSSAESDVPER